MSEQQEQRKGRSNAILTYETVEGINIGILQVNNKLDNLGEKVDSLGRTHVDHEVRIRALELSQARSTGSFGFAGWAFGALIAGCSILFAVLNYIK